MRAGVAALTVCLVTATMVLSSLGMVPSSPRVIPSGGGWSPPFEVFQRLASPEGNGLRAVGTPVVSAEPAEVGATVPPPPVGGPASPLARLEANTSATPSLDPNGSGYAEETLVLGNGTVLPGDFLPPAAREPAALAYDPQDDEVIVADFASADVTVFAAASGDWLTTIPVGIHPDAVAFDPANGDAYVANAGSANVSVISGASRSIVATVGTANESGSFGYPELIAIDSAHDQVFVADFGSSSVSVISGATNSLTATIPVAGPPAALAYDPVAGSVDVADYGYNYSCACSDVTVINASRDAVSATVPVGYYPDGIAVDEANGQVFVANLGANTVSVFSDANDSVLATIPVGKLPDAITVDPANGDVYVVNGNYTGSGVGNISVISGISDTVVATASVRGVPTNVVVDNPDADLYVADTACGCLSVLNASNDSVAATVFVGADPFAMAVDGANGSLFVANLGLSYGNGSVMEVAGTAVVAKLPRTDLPGPLALDPRTGTVYVGDENPNNVTVVNGTTGELGASVAVPDGVRAMAYDPADGDLFVVGTYSDNVTVINASSNTIVATVPVGLFPGPIAIDPVDGSIFVGNTGSANVSVISGATFAVVATLAVNWDPVVIRGDPTNGMVYVLSAGLGDISGWIFDGSLAAVNGATYNVSSVVPLGLVPQGMVVDSVRGTIYVSETGDDNVTVLNAASLQVVATVRVGSEPFAMAIDPAGDALFVANALSQNVSVVSTTTDGVVASVPTGSEPYGLTVGPDGLVFVRNANSSNLTVINTTTYLWLTVPVGLLPDAMVYDANSSNLFVANYDSGTLSIVHAVTFATAYEVSFSQSGLLAPKPWFLTIGSRTLRVVGPTANAWLTNGSFPYLIRGPRHYVVSALPPAGTLAVEGSGLRLTFEFVAGGVHQLNFVEYGPGGPFPLCVTFADALEQCTYGSHLAFGNLSPGSYPYSIAPQGGYLVKVSWWSGRPASPSGVANITTTDRTLVVRFEYLYNLTFEETGLPQGTEWSVTVGKVTLSSTTPTITFSLPNGTYWFHLGKVPGFSIRGVPWPVRVRGSDESVQARFAARR